MAPATGPTRSEDSASAAIGGAGVVASIVGLVLLLREAASAPGSLPAFGAAIYGATLIVAFLASTLYHGAADRRVKRAMCTVDHCTIFLLIAGTDTPIALTVLWRHDGAALLAAVWLPAGIGIVQRLLRGSRSHRIAIAHYPVMGWLGVGWSHALYDALEPTAIVLMLLGGAIYTGGLLFCRWDRLPYNGALWHVCVVTASVAFFLAVTFCMIPAGIA